MTEIDNLAEYKIVYDLCTYFPSGKISIVALLTFPDKNLAVLVCIGISYLIIANTFESTF